MKQQFLAMIDKKIVEKNRLKDSAFNSGIGEFIDIEIGALQELRSEVEKMEEGEVILTKKEYERLQEKVWRYDDLCK